MTLTELMEFTIHTIMTYSFYKTTCYIYSGASMWPLLITIAIIYVVVNDIITFCNQQCMILHLRACDVYIYVLPYSHKILNLHWAMIHVVVSNITVICKAFQGMFRRNIGIQSMLGGLYFQQNISNLYNLYIHKYCSIWLPSNKLTTIVSMKMYVVVTYCIKPVLYTVKPP